jgi:CYTH domain-containing protein
MDNSATTEFKRFYLIEALPEPLTRASPHTQLFDNYVPATRLRLRSIRYPETKAWTYLLEQRSWTEAELPSCDVTRVGLNEAEHAALEHLEGTEIRKNRYTLEVDGRMFEFDVYLGKLWRLNRAAVSFESLADMQAFQHPGEAYFEVTGNAFFRDENIVERTLDDIQAEIARMQA